MEKEIFINSIKYIPSKIASSGVGYTNDYITRLCREGSLNCEMVGNLWFISEDSLNEFVIEQEYKKILYKQNLSKERKQEHKFNKRILKNKFINNAPNNSNSRGLTQYGTYTDVEERVTESKVRHLHFPSNIVLDTAYKSTICTDSVSEQSPIPTTIVTQDFIHKAVALITAVAIVFSVSSFAGVEYMHRVANTINNLVYDTVQIARNIPNIVRSIDGTFTKSLKIADSITTPTSALSTAILSNESQATYTAIDIYNGINNAIDNAGEFISLSRWFTVDDSNRGIVEISLIESPTISKDTKDEVLNNNEVVNEKEVRETLEVEK